MGEGGIGLYTRSANTSRKRLDHQQPVGLHPVFRQGSSPFDIWAVQSYQEQLQLRSQNGALIYRAEKEDDVTISGTPTPASTGP